MKRSQARRGTKGRPRSSRTASKREGQWGTLADFGRRIFPAVWLVEELRVALEESVKLQSHYASLLNLHDGGNRIGFTDADAWIARLRETGTLPRSGSSA